MIGQVVLALAILIGLHEAGHMLAAKAFGMRVEKFSIGFPPKIFSFKAGETEYSLGAIPLGGFVKISGMIDESLDMESMASEPEPWEFRAKPAWQRLIVMMGGIIVNVILGVIIFISLTYFYGDEYIPREEVVKHGIVAGDYGQEIGLKTGDKITELNGTAYKSFNDLKGVDAILEDDSYYTVERGGKELRVNIPPNVLEVMSDKEKAANFFEIRFPFVVDAFSDNIPYAKESGLQKGDKILAVNGKAITYFDELQEEVQQNRDGKVELTVLRGEERLNLTSKVDTAGYMGMQPKPELNMATQTYNFGESLNLGTDRAFGSVVANVKGFGTVISRWLDGDASLGKSVKGPMGIATIYGGEWIWAKFWSITAILSMWLAFVNFLPIPALDGGHVMFLSYEMISGTKPSDKFLEVAQKVGMAIVLTLMILVLGNDFWQMIFG